MDFSVPTQITNTSSTFYTSKHDKDDSYLLIQAIVPYYGVSWMLPLLRWGPPRLFHVESYRAEYISYEDSHVLNMTFSSSTPWVLSEALSSAPDKESRIFFSSGVKSFTLFFFKVFPTLWSDQCYSFSISSSPNVFEGLNRSKELFMCS